MRITFVNDSIGYGGAAKVMTVIAKGLANKGHSVSIINLNLNNAGIYQDTAGLEIITANLKFGKGLLVNLKYSLFTIKAVKTLHSDILIGFKTFPNFCAVLAGMVLNIPSVISERANPFVVFRNPRFSTKVKLFFINHASAAVFQTEGASKFYSKHLQEKSAIIPNPILFDGSSFFVNYDKRPKTVVSLGRFDNKQKRLDVLIESFALFHKSHPDYSLVIYGAGKDENMLMPLIKRENLEESVRVAGLSRNSLNDLSREGIFIITSDYEGISNSLLEAMAVGLPVVSTDHSPGGARMLITDHENGLLVPVGDAPAIAAALSEYAENPDLARECGINAKKVLDRFALEKIVEKWEGTLQKTVNQYS